MSDEKKPRNIKDLKARLGRPAGATSDSPASGSVPPPVVGPAAVPGLGGDVAPPPFLQQPASGPAPAAEARVSRPAPIDPFATATGPASPQEVRLVIDEKPVSDDEVGKKRGRAIFITTILGVVLGLLIGYLGGGTMGERRLHNAVVRDAKEIYGEFQTATDAFNKASTLVKRIQDRTRVSGNQRPTVDYEAITQLQSIQAPFRANVFAGKHYKAFTPETVDSLFAYYNNVRVLFDKFQTLAALTAESRRGELDRSAQATTELAQRQVGCVPFRGANETLGCGLVYVDMPTLQEGQPFPEKLNVRARSGGQAAEKTRYTGQDLAENPEQYVVLVDTPSSVGVLGQSASTFAEYVNVVNQIKALTDQIAEQQGLLETQLGQVASNREIFAL